MALQTIRTLSELRSVVAVRLGYVVNADTLNINQPLIDSWLQSAANQLYEEFEDQLKRPVNVSAQNQDAQSLLITRLAVPTVLDPYHINSLSVQFGGSWMTMEGRITDVERNNNAPATLPVKWDINFDSNEYWIELWPLPDKIYTFRFDGTGRTVPFTADTDLCPVYPDELVFLHALANGKAHNQMPDAEVISGQFENLLMRVRANQIARGKYNRGTPYNYGPLQLQRSCPQFRDSGSLAMPRAGTNVLIDNTILAAAVKPMFAAMRPGSVVTVGGIQAAEVFTLQKCFTNKSGSDGPTDADFEDIKMDGVVYVLDANTNVRVLAGTGLYRLVSPITTAGAITAIVDHS